MRRFCIVAVSVGSLLIAGAPAQAGVAVKSHRQKSRGDTVRLHHAAPTTTVRHAFTYGRT